MFWIYLGIFAGMVLEGDLVLLAAALASHQRLVPALPTFIFAFISVMIGDTLWYLLGRAVAPRWLWLTRLTDRLTGWFKPRLEKQFFLSIFISKFTYGLNHAVLVRVGLDQTPWPKYLKTILAANLVWVSTLGGLGYVFGSSFGLLRHYVRYGEIALLLIFVAGILLDRAIGRLVKSLANE